MKRNKKPQKVQKALSVSQILSELDDSQEYLALLTLYEKSEMYDIDMKKLQDNIRDTDNVLRSMLSLHNSLMLYVDILEKIRKERAIREKLSEIAKRSKKRVSYFLEMRLSALIKTLVRIIN